VACHKNGTSIVANGEFKGRRLDELIREKGAELLGTEVSKEYFPLLIKLINARENLSVQVHPDNRYADEVEGEMGKTEIWYVVEAFDDASIIVGAKEGCTR
jgi:mannose-6-phosphate isomerase